MYARLALRNIRRSLSDYLVYFVTLVLAVALFYIFNSLRDQPALALLAEQERLRFQFMDQMVAMVSIFVSLVMAVLVLYANSFLIRRRKRELGTYMLLGMRQGKVASLLFVESVVIGTVALGAGLALGVLLSQFLAVVVARFFETNLDGLSFVLSAPAVLKTALFYGFSFLLVGLFGSATVSRYKLVDMVDADTRNEPQLLRVTWLQILILLASLGLTGWSYKLAFQTIGAGRVDPRDFRLWLVAICGSVGTFGLYYGLSGMASYLFSQFKGIYYRGLNPFIFRQTTSKINSNIRVLATITIMLTVTICALGWGFAFRDNLMAQYDAHAPYDFIIWGGGTDPDLAPIYEVLSGSEAEVGEVVAREAGFELIKFHDYAFPEGGAREGILYQEMRGPNAKVAVLSVSTFNQLRSMRGYPQVQLRSGEYLIHQTDQHDGSEYGVEKWMRDGVPISLAGHELVPGSEQPLKGKIGGFFITGNSLTALIVEDAIAEQLPVMQVSMMVNFPGRGDGTLDAQLEQAAKLAYGRGGMGTMSGYGTWMDMLLSTALMVFVGLYIGIVFLMASATVLSLQQLTDAADNRHKYSILSKIGAGERMLSGALFRHLAIYFLIPVIVAAVHSSVALTALNLAAVKTGGEPVLQGALVSGGVFMVIYGIYFVLTHVGYKRTLGWER